MSIKLYLLGVWASPTPTGVLIGGAGQELGRVDVGRNPCRNLAVMLITILTLILILILIVIIVILIILAVGTCLQSGCRAEHEVRCVREHCMFYAHRSASAASTMCARALHVPWSQVWVCCCLREGEVASKVLDARAHRHGGPWFRCTYRRMKGNALVLLPETSLRSTL